MYRFVTLLLCTTLCGCVVLPATTTGVNHPHGGPPGQMKKHHMHGAECGHRRVKYEGVWIYSVDGQWWKHKGDAWVVVAYREEDAKGNGKGNGKAKGKGKGKK